MRLALLAAVLIATLPARAADIWYLTGDGVPVASLDGTPPTSTSLPNFDPLRDASPGLLLVRGGDGPTESDPGRYQQWMTAPLGAQLDGPTALVFWAAMDGFVTGRRGVVEAWLLDCEATGTACTEIAHAGRDILDWSGGWGSWGRHAIGFGRIDHTVAAGRSLAVRIVVGAAADDDMMFAYGSAGFASYLTDGYPDDIAVDCEFGDWSNGGTEHVVNDQGGPDDWASPGRLDLTRFGMASNLVDAIHVLMGFDDVPVLGGTAATLIDTDIDSRADLALVATVNGSQTAVELYACDDTLIDGCGAAVLRRSYPATSYCAASATGPWGSDSFIEIALPLHDLGPERDHVFLTSLISYAAASMLTSAKDSVLGAAGQDYRAGIDYDFVHGVARPSPGLGSGFIVRRSTDPAAVRTADPVATVSRAPFDDLPGILADGATYFWVIEQEGELPVSLSAHANAFDGTVRLGFDDGDPLSAAADPALSTVGFDVIEIPADGTAVATLTVVPRDARGVPLGSGCRIEIEAASLAPAGLGGPVVDRGDGSYTVPVTSVVPGAGVVAVSVEGIALATQPAIVAVAP